MALAKCLARDERGESDLRGEADFPTCKCARRRTLPELRAVAGADYILRLWMWKRRENALLRRSVERRATWKVVSKYSLWRARKQPAPRHRMGHRRRRKRARLPRDEARVGALDPRPVPSRWRPLLF